MPDQNLQRVTISGDRLETLAFALRHPRATVRWLKHRGERWSVHGNAPARHTVAVLADPENGRPLVVIGRPDGSAERLEVPKSLSAQVLDKNTPNERINWWKTLIDRERRWAPADTQHAEGVVSR